MNKKYENYGIPIFDEDNNMIGTCIDHFFKATLVINSEKTSKNIVNGLNNKEGTVAAVVANTAGGFDTIASNQFRDALYNMKLGERIKDNAKHLYGYDWVITRVPNGWIYTAETALSPCSVFIPYSDEPNIPY